MAPLNRVLLAVPDPASRRALSLLLRNKLGLDCLGEAADGEALAQALAEAPPDLVLLDWNLPGRPSAEAWRHWRAANPTARLAILSIDTRAAPEAEALGAVFIYKGAAAEVALEQLRRLVRREP